MHTNTFEQFTHAFKIHSCFLQVKLRRYTIFEFPWVWFRVSHYLLELVQNEVVVNGSNSDLVLLFVANISSASSTNVLYSVLVSPCVICEENAQIPQ